MKIIIDMINDIIIIVWTELLLKLLIMKPIVLKMSDWRQLIDLGLFIQYCDEEKLWAKGTIISVQWGNAVNEANYY